MFILKLLGVRFPLVIGLLALSAAGALLVPRMFVNAGLLALLQGNGDGARNSLRQAYAISPDNRTLLVMYTDRLREQGRYKEAKPVLGEYAARHPNDPTIRIRLLESAAFSGEVSTATIVLMRQLDWSGISPEVAAVMADYALQHKSEFALSEIVKLTSIAMNWPEGQAEITLVLQGLLQAQSSDETIAIRDALHWRARSVVDSNAVVPTRHTKDKQKETNNDQFAAKRYFVANGVQLRLGPDLAINGGFEEINNINATPAIWRKVAWQDTQKYTDLGYVLGDDNDAYEGNAALRIVVALQSPETEGRERSRVGVWHPQLTLKPERTYLVSLVYKATSDILRIYFSEQGSQFSQEVWLPKSPETWQRVEILATNQAKEMLAIQPLIRVWGKGSVTLDDFSVREVVEPINFRLDKPILHIAPADQ